MHGLKVCAAQTTLLLALMTYPTLIFVASCTREPAPPPPSQGAIPCDVGEPPLTAADIDGASQPLAAWLRRFYARYDAAGCPRTR